MVFKSFQSKSTLTDSNDDDVYADADYTDDADNEDEEDADTIWPHESWQLMQ